jgi:diadenosine tetraphosphate (Ap4A) HIT family hydrolase
MACPACERLARLPDGFLIAGLRESFWILHKHQRYAGWSTLWLKDHAEHTGLLPRERAERLGLDVLDAAGAMHRAFDGEGVGGGPIRINYENLGNVVAHVHWHLIPRRASDPEPGATVWVRPVAETDCGVSDSERDRLVGLLKRSLGERGGQGARG